MTGIALLDDYPEPGLGHHPDLLTGLAEAARRGPGLPGPTRIHCPPAFVAGRTLAAGIEHHDWVRAAGASPQRHRERMSALVREAAGDLLINLFFDESHTSFPVSTHPAGSASSAGFHPLAMEAPVVQVLHRPAELADTVAGTGRDRDRTMVEYLRHTVPDGLVVVHTLAAHATAARWLDPDRVLRLAWPAASEAEVTARFADAAAWMPPAEPHALLIGDARDAKGVHDLLAALAGDSPLLRIVGNQPDGVEAALRARYPATRVDWETGWVERERLDAAIRAASVVVFPYLPEFGRHGGVSGALAQALTFGKPLVVSTVLADQLPASHAALLVEPGDVRGLRRAVDEALLRSAELHRAATATADEVREAHGYDRHLARIVAGA